MTGLPIVQILQNDKEKGNFQYKNEPSVKFTPDQLKKLEEAFQKDAYMKGKQLQELADSMDSTCKRVQNWFKHKRSRLASQGKFKYKPRFE
jgi:phage host-nuclease inhibitor protein Gam